MNGDLSRWYGRVASMAGERMEEIVIIKSTERGKEEERIRGEWSRATDITTGDVAH